MGVVKKRPQQYRRRRERSVPRRRRAPRASPGSLYRIQMAPRRMVRILFIWTEKLTFLSLLKRVTRGLAVERAVLPVIELVVTSYLIIVFVVTSYCRPFYKYWQFNPDPGDRCHPDTPGLYIAVLIMNIVTDACIAIIPIPAKKTGISVVLCGGVFTMAASIIRVYYSINMESLSAIAPPLWACDEAMVSCFVVNAPIFVALFRKSFWRSGKLTITDQSNDTPGCGRSTELASRRRHKPCRFRHPHGMDTWLATDNTNVDVERTSSTDAINPIRVYTKTVAK
ncbi:hypothetical protein PG996_005804 [Apiospora saccharicola]|uniref:Rhodopsin domain-containing protein n=1 Tax=Apiospora saccharicola TaxID=335842 RepID=A0ABR1VQ73_9PEZI